MAIYHTLKDYDLPCYLSIEIVTTETINGIYISPRLTIDEVVKSKEVFILSTIHQNKRVKISFSYGVSFTDDDILNDGELFITVCNMYELSLTKVLKQN